MIIYFLEKEQNLLMFWNVAGQNWANQFLFINLRDHYHIKEELMMDMLT